MTDKLNMEALNQLPHPITAEFGGGDHWPVEDIDVTTGLMRIDVVGKLQIKEFCEVVTLRDADGGEHDPDDFYN